jgi:NADPH:quinone reductase-like Zn-dependent oxidoreductase
MRAITAERFGGPEVLELRDVDRPEIGDDDVLVRVHAASVNPLDWHYMTGLPYLTRLSAGLRRPRRGIPGVDVAGRVEAVGRSVTRFRPGDDVFGWGRGAFAEYLGAPADHFVMLPTGTSFAEAAAVPIAGLTALQALRDKGAVRSGHKVLINGASGGVGTFAVQISRSIGAEVTGVCSTGNVELVRSLGAAHVVDYTRDDFAASEDRYDVMIDNVGNRSLATCRRALAPGGVYVLVGGPKTGRWFGPLTRLVRALFVFRFTSRNVAPLLARETNEDLRVLRDLLESGAVTSVVGRTYDLADTADALRHLQTGHARGKIIITT